MSVSRSQRALTPAQRTGTQASGGGGEVSLGEQRWGDLKDDSNRGRACGRKAPGRGNSPSKAVETWERKEP